MLDKKQLKTLADLLEEAIKSQQFLVSVEERSEIGPMDSTSLCSHTFEVYDTSDEEGDVIEVSMSDGDYLNLAPHWIDRDAQILVEIESSPELLKKVRSLIGRINRRKGLAKSTPEERSASASHAAICRHSKNKAD